MLSISEVEKLLDLALSRGVRTLAIPGELAVEFAPGAAPRAAAEPAHYATALPADLDKPTDEQLALWSSGAGFPERKQSGE